MSLNGVKLDIQWCPNDSDKFITWGTEIYLYKVLSEPGDTIYELLASNSNHQYIKCVDIYPQQGSDILLAVGQANGRIGLTTFGPSRYDTLGISGKEFVPRHPRQCNALAWNPIDCNLIISGYDKGRSDNSLLLWDVLKCTYTTDGNNTRMNMPGYSRPVQEVANSETVHSLSWFRTQPRTVIAGMNLKQLKIFDMRDSVKVVNSTLTKAVLGCTVDPNNDRQVASFFDTHICVWDLRNFDKPVLTSMQNRSIHKIVWCPTRNNLLSSLQRDCNVIHLHDVLGNDDVEQAMLERVVLPNSTENLNSFSWHPTDENRLLYVDMLGTIKEFTIFERITLNLSPNCNLVWTHGKKTFKLKENPSELFNSIGDISVKMRSRSLKDYGLKNELWKNGELADDSMLKGLWDWLYLSKCLVEEGPLKGTGLKHPGVRSVLKLESDTSSTLNSTCDLIPWSDVSSNVAPVKVYSGDERTRALNLCGWRFGKDPDQLKIFLERSEIDNMFSKAAAIAVFNLEICLGIDTLHRGAEKTKNQNLSMVAMALAGFSDGRNSLWREFCHKTLKNLTDPYLRAMFAFLTAEDSYDFVLNESGVAVEDRIAFACKYLPDNKLAEYLKQLTVALTEEGNLAALLLTGTANSGINVLQKYLDRTGDVQSVSLISIKAFPTNLTKETPVQDWINSYRNLLDTWQLWKQRALLDIELNSSNAIEKPAQQVYVSCNYCGKSISAYMQAINRGRGPFARLGASTNKLKLSSCPHCRKPLPRCAICLMNMGTASSSFEHSRSEDDSKMIEFSSWFTWCQTCRHGGHAEHITQWFRDHSECPVTACSCKCFSIDYNC